jgi:hypothetical protein
MGYEYTSTERFLLRRALTRGNSSATLMQRAKAIEQLCEQDVPVPHDRVRAELAAVRDNVLGTYQAGQAAAKALRLLGIMDGLDEVEYPSETPLELALRDYWLYDFRPARHGMESFRDVDQAVPMTCGEVDERRERVEGPPPWRKDGRSDSLAPDAEGVWEAICEKVEGESSYFGPFDTEEQVRKWVADEQAREGGRKVTVIRRVEEY